jgi:hypothetical protein
MDAGPRSVYKMNISQELFTKFRTPDEQAEFFNAVNNYIDANKELKQKARLREGPFKTFIEEFMPFTWYCEWKFGGRSDIECALVKGTQGRDAIIIRRKDTKSEHNVEITWPINGEKLKINMKELNEKGHTFLDFFDSKDTSLHEEAVLRTISIANKKSLRDYRSDCGSTLIFYILENQIVILP